MTGTENARLAVGLMSGTSCDGVDAAFVQISGPVHAPMVEFVAFAYLPYGDALRKRLLDPEKSGAEICTLNVELAEAFAAAALTAIARAGHAPADVSFIASHGHTLCHYPPGARSAYRGTLQLGEAAYIAEKTGCDVVSNFRPRDMAAGGQGAPLVPYADWLLFRRTGQAVATLNIGGIANFTVLLEKADEVYAFDSGPGNMLIDGCLSLLGHESRYDLDGALAATGKTIP
ncbi:MAG: anhydro-N-acetylmuramic acid kinase, partial [Rhodocyclaceae bacterium]|nr:anhydro-N-acetylmuramic acid kinase [Rhodocyclaceae bacterium]